MIEKDFSGWLLQQLQIKKYSQADLARASGLSRTAISDIINRKRISPDNSTLKAIAHGLELSIEEVYRAAGLLPDLPAPRDLYEEIVNHRLTLLDDAQLEDVLKYIDFIMSKDQKPIQLHTEPKSGKYDGNRT